MTAGYGITEIIVLACLATFLAAIGAFCVFAIWRMGKRAAWRQLAETSPRCLRCNYDLRGLTEARCPECGASYTLEELWIAQRDRVTPRGRRSE